MTYVEPADRATAVEYGTDWDIARAEVRCERSDYRCECGEPARTLCITLSQIKDGGDAGDKANLQGLCIACHFNAHRKVADTLRPTWDKLLK